MLHDADERALTADTTQDEFEARWLAYAHKVLTVPCGCPCDGELSWPGYLGQEYAVGRVLLVGAIHNAPVLRSSGIFEIAPDVEAFVKASPGDPQRYLDVVREAYVKAIPRWKTYVNEKGQRITETVWKRLLLLVDAFGIPLTQIAFTNLAKCALPSGSGWAIEKLAELIKHLEPRYVLIAKDCAGLSQILGLKANPPIPRYCHNLTFTSGTDLFSIWKQQDAARYVSGG